MANNGKKVTKTLVATGSSQVKGFLDFIRSQGVMGLAVGLVLGTAVTALVTSLINNIVMPPLGLLLGSANGLKGLTLTIGTTHDGAPVVMDYGTFLNDFINFLVIAFVAYMFVKILGVQITKK